MMKKTMTHQERVALYVRILEAKMPKPLTDFSVAYVRNAAPSREELSAINEALFQMGWKR